MPCKWNYSAWGLFRLASFTSQYARKVHPCCCEGPYTLCSTRQYSIVRIRDSWPIRSPVEAHLSFFQILVIIIKPAIHIHGEVFGGRTFSVQLGKSLGVWFPNQMLSLYLALQKTTKLFSQVTILFCILVSNVQSLKVLLSQLCCITW